MSDMDRPPRAVKRGSPGTGAATTTRHATTPVGIASLIQRKAACSCGGTCPSCAATANLPVSQPGEAMEHEADRVASQVMQGRAVARPTPAGAPTLSRAADGDRSPGSASSAAPALGLSSGGQALAAETRAFMEPRLGQDLAHVRVHDDDHANASARALSARAYTVGSDVLNNLGSTGFNDRASSMRIERGYWMFCTDANFLGDCRTFGPGDYPSLSWLSNRISSGRRISNDYPYNAPPRWQN